MIPNTSVSPAASRKIITPNCSPLSTCSSARLIARERSEAALRGVDVAGVAHDLADAANRELPGLGVLHDLRAVPVLDRELVRPKLERAAGRLEIGLAQRGPERVGLREVAVDGTQGARDQLRRVVALARIRRRIAMVFGEVV